MKNPFHKHKMELIWEEPVKAPGPGPLHTLIPISKMYMECKCGARTIDWKYKEKLSWRKDRHIDSDVPEYKEFIRHGDPESTLDY